MPYRFDKIHLLLVEDNAHMCQLMRTLLLGMGINNVKVAHDGMSAVEMLQDNIFDLIITDLAMEPMNGLELTSLIRSAENSANATMPIIVMTGHSERNLVEQARDAGINEFMCKPMTAKALFSRIVAAVEHPRDYIRTKSYFGPDRRRKTNNNWSGTDRRKSAPVPSKVKGAA